MADQDPNSSNNGAGQEGEVQVAVLHQYIKDLSVECPNSPAVFQWQAQPQVDIQFNINVNNVSDEVHEVILKVSVAARSDNGAHFLIDLSYACLLGLRNVPADAVGPFLLIEAPRMTFPFVRQIVAEAVGNTGFPPLLLEPIDFNAAYVQQLQALQSDEGEAPADTSNEEPPEGSDQNNS
jgi:preprotein translocase subunit SecB